MKKHILFVLFMLFAGAAVVNAQDAPQRRTVEERTKAAMEKITPALSLNKTQEAQTDSVFTEYYKAMDKFRESLEPGTRPDRSQFEKFSNERDEKLKKIFSAEQFKKFKDEVEATLRPQRRQQRS
jgi:membrane-associated HD superfamily phosphohydrolase